MSKGLSTRAIPGIVTRGIWEARKEWLRLSGESLDSAPEYLLTVQVAQRLAKEIPAAKRTVWMERNVADVLEKAGAIQPGPLSNKLRADGRFDLVLGHADGRPRVLIELKSPVPVVLGKGVVKDLRRLCSALLHAPRNTQIHQGILAFYSSAAPPKKKDGSATARLRRKADEWKTRVPACRWVEKAPDRKRHRSALEFAVHCSLKKGTGDFDGHAGMAVCVVVKRRPPSKRGKSAS